MKFKATIEVVYDADPVHYGDVTVDEMLAIDREAFEGDPHMLLDIGEFTVKIEEAG